MRRSGLPSPGTEGMGVLLGVGAQVGDFAVGDRVTTTQAERTYADAFLVDAAKAKEGDVAVVTAAAGGVGGLLVQLLRKQGATVIALVGSEEKADAARSLGADVALVGYGDFAERVREATGAAWPTSSMTPLAATRSASRSGPCAVAGCSCCTAPPPALCRTSTCSGSTTMGPST